MHTPYHMSTLAKTILTLTCLALLLPLTLQTDLNKLGKACTSNDQCSVPYITCQYQKCKHKKLFPMASKEIIGTIILIILTILSTAAGIGPGPLIVPLGLILFDFDTKQAVALANGLTVFVCLVKCIVGLTRKHPKIPHKALIDYNIVLIFISSILMGSLIGSLIARIFPDLPQQILLLVVVCLAVYQTTIKAIELYKGETKEQNALKLQEEEQIKKEMEKNDNVLIKEVFEENAKIKIPRHYTFSTDKRLNNKKEQAQMDSDTADINKIELVDVQIKKEEQIKVEIKEPPSLSGLTEEESKIQLKVRSIEANNFYPKKFGIVIIGTCLSLLVIFLRGGSGFTSIIGATQCSSLDWIILACYIILLAILALLGALFIHQDEAQKEKGRWNFTEIDKKVTKSFFIKGNIIGLITGLIASITGIGVGIIINPVLLSFKIIPQVITFVSMYLTFWNKIVSGTVDMLSGQMPVDYMLFMGVILVLGVFFSEWKLDQIIKKFGRQSYISFLFSIILVISIILIIIVAINTIKTNQVENIPMFGFKSFCG